MYINYIVIYILVYHHFLSDMPYSAEQLSGNAVREALFSVFFIKRCCILLNAHHSPPFTRNAQHRLFLIVCKILCPSVDVIAISRIYPDGGKIGIGDSYLNRLFKFCKILRLHAAFHDAFGLMRNTFNIGPGYCYATTAGLPNICFLGHITGIIYWLKIFLFHRDLFDNISV